MVMGQRGAIQSAEIISVISKRIIILVFLIIISMILMPSTGMAGIDSWTQLGGPGGGKINAVAVSPDFVADSTILAGTNAGIFKSTDGGISWNSSSNGLESPGTYALAFSPDFASDSTVFVGTSSGIFKSTDGGASWSVLNLGGVSNNYDSPVTVSPNYVADQTVLVGQTYDKGVIKSTDGGVSWSQYGLNGYRVNAIAYSPNYAHDYTLYAGTSAGGVFAITETPACTRPSLNLSNSRVY